MSRYMKSLKLENHIILENLIKEIRPVSEQGVVVWNTGLTKRQIWDIENIQKVNLKIFLGEKYLNYSLACKFLELCTALY